MKRKPVIFIVEDDPGLNKLFTAFLTNKGAGEVYSCMTGEECLDKLKTVQPDIVVQDFELPGINGIETMIEVKKVCPNTKFIFLSGQTSIKIAVEALKLGAFDYIVKDTYAKDSLVNKINQIATIERLGEETKRSKTLMILFLVIAALAWITFFVQFMFFR
ncbi:MAG: response regulator [Bacteroidales bacterium]